MCVCVCAHKIIRVLNFNLFRRFYLPPRSLRGIFPFPKISSYLSRMVTQWKRISNSSNRSVCVCYFWALHFKNTQNTHWTNTATAMLHCVDKFQFGALYGYFALADNKRWWWWWWDSDKAMTNKALEFFSATMHALRLAFKCDPNPVDTRFIFAFVVFCFVLLFNICNLQFGVCVL